ncbi:MAG: hypothetical protein FWC06_08305 [Treponema sp.]|nr:hypothetical protein [Treponema sp.]
MAEEKYPGAYTKHDPNKWEYDFGDTEFTGDFDKLPPNIQRIANQIHKDAFGDNDTNQKQDQ